MENNNTDWDNVRVILSTKEIDVIPVEYATTQTGLDIYEKYAKAYGSFITKLMGFTSKLVIERNIVKFESKAQEFIELLKANSANQYYIDSINEGLINIRSKFLQK